MKMFASDLDRTLIYSERALAEFKQDIKDFLVGVEQKDQRHVAFMTKEALIALREISEKMLFVPVTTRTFEQFKRIFIFQDEIPLTYAVTSNGAKMLYKGKPLREWEDTVQKRLKMECANIEEMVSKLQEASIIGTLKRVEDLFFYYILSEEITLEAKNRISAYAGQRGWRVSLQGRKLYLMPKPVCKGEAVKFIKEREGINTVFGAGDSLLDHDFLKVCDYSYVPNHGEIINENINELNYFVSQNRGVKAGEEILFGISDILKARIQSG